MEAEQIKLTVKRISHTEVELINDNGDTFTYNPNVHEEFEDFLSGCKALSEVAPKQEQEEIIDFSVWYSGMGKSKVQRAYDRYLQEKL